MTLPTARLRVVVVLALAGLASVLGAQRAEAQRSCTAIPPMRSLNSITLAGGGRITYLGLPRLRCEDGVYIQADSAVIYSAQNMSHLIGNVRFVEGSQELRANEARYFTQQGRLSAEGNLFVRDTVRGTEIENGDLVYFRQTEFRDTPQMTVNIGVRDRIRPRAKLYVRQPPEPPPATEVPDSS